MSNYLAQIMHPSWIPAMAETEPMIKEIDKKLATERAAGRTHLPTGKAILRAFSQPFDEIKVLILGQDPYPTVGHAMGMAFSVHKGVELPRSLANIFKELHNDLGLPQPSSGDLSPWTNQGVLLLNRVLTVQEGEPNSHKNIGWEAVTEVAIRALAKREAPLVAILWGAAARSAKPFLGKTPIIESAHPSPLSAHNGFFNSRPFSRANTILQQLGTSPVDWRLP